MTLQMHTLTGMQIDVAQRHTQLMLLLFTLLQPLTRILKAIDIACKAASEALLRQTPHPQER